jgi:hypothetical protein
MDKRGGFGDSELRLESGTVTIPKVKAIVV